MSNREFEHQRAVELVEQLESHYKNYMQLPEEPPKQWDLSRLFRGWFSNNESQSEPIHQTFLAGTESLCRELTQTLDKLEPEVSGPLALRGVQLILEHSGACSDRDRASYLIAAEQLVIPLLRYLAPNELEAQREAMLARTPKRMMFPKQLEILQTIEHLIEENHPQ